jgi:hypothetical protein
MQQVGGSSEPVQFAAEHLSRDNKLVFKKGAANLKIHTKNTLIRECFLYVFSWPPLLDEFRTINWKLLAKEMQVIVSFQRIQFLTSYSLQ